MSTQLMKQSRTSWMVMLSALAVFATAGSSAYTQELRPVETIKILTLTAAEGPARFEQARLIAESWQAAGIPAEIEPGRQIGKRGFAAKDFDIYIIIYDPTTDRLDPENFLARFITAKAVDNGSNLSGYVNRPMTSSTRHRSTQPALTLGLLRYTKCSSSSSTTSRRPPSFTS